MPPLTLSTARKYRSRCSAFVRDMCPASLDLLDASVRTFTHNDRPLRAQSHGRRCRKTPLKIGAWGNCTFCAAQTGNRIFNSKEKSPAELFGREGQVRANVPPPARGRDVKDCCSRGVHRGVHCFSCLVLLCFGLSGWVDRWIDPPIHPNEKSEKN